MDMEFFVGDSVSDLKVEKVKAKPLKADLRAHIFYGPTGPARIPRLPTPGQAPRNFKIFERASRSPCARSGLETFPRPRR